MFTAVAVLSLALGIGANTAIFTLLDQVLLRLLPVKDRAKSLTLLTMRGRHYGSNWGGNAISYPMYRDFQDHNQVFTGMFCRFSQSMSAHLRRPDGTDGGGDGFGHLFSGAGGGGGARPDRSRRTTIRCRAGHPLVVLSYDLLEDAFRRRSERWWARKSS